MLREFLDVSRRRKRRWALIKLSSWVFVIFLFLGGVVSLFYIPQLRIDDISISGAETLNEAALRSQISEILSGKYFFILPKDNIFFVPSSQLSEIFSSNLRVAEFKIKRGFPSALKITLRERKTWAVWCRMEEGEAKECALSDERGFIFARAPIFQGTAILKVKDERGEHFLGKNFIAPEKILEFQNLMAQIKSRFGEDTVAIEVKPGEIFNFFMKGGWFFILDGEVNTNVAFENLVLALETQVENTEELDYIDLRFKDKVFYRFHE